MLWHSDAMVDRNIHCNHVTITSLVNYLAVSVVLRASIRFGQLGAVEKLRWATKHVIIGRVDESKEGVYVIPTAGERAVIWGRPQSARVKPFSVSTFSYRMYVYINLDYRSTLKTAQVSVIGRSWYGKELW